MSLRLSLPTSSGWLSDTCASAALTSSSSVSPRTTAPHSQLISLAHRPLLSIDSADCERAAHAVTLRKPCRRRGSQLCGQLLFRIAGADLTDRSARSEGASPLRLSLRAPTASGASVRARGCVVGRAGRDVPRQAARPCRVSAATRGGSRLGQRPQLSFASLLPADAYVDTEAALRGDPPRRGCRSPRRLGCCLGARLALRST